MPCRRVPPPGSIQDSQLYCWFRPGRIQFYRPLVGTFCLFWSSGDLVKMPELQREVRIVRSELLCLEVVRLGIGQISGLLEHMPTLNMNSRVIRNEAQGFFV